MISNFVFICLLVPSIALAGVQKVCINKTDKYGKQYQTCKLMKKHVKHNGTKFPAKGGK